MIDPALSPVIRTVSNTYALPYDLFVGQILQESDGDPNALRFEHDFWIHYIEGRAVKAAAYGPLAACSFGMLQILLETAMEIGFDGRPEQLFDPKVGLAWGAKKMQALWLWAGGKDPDYARALSAYNGGTRRAIGPPFPNQAYVDGVYAKAGRTT